MGKKTRVFMGEGLGGWFGEPEFMRDFAWRWGISMYQEGVYSWLKGVGLSGHIQHHLHLWDPWGEEEPEH